MDFPLDCPTLDQINPEPLQDIFWPFMLPITVDTNSPVKSHFSMDTPTSTYQESSTYISLEPCVPTNYVDSLYMAPSPTRYTTPSILTEDSVVSDCDSDMSQREVCEASILGKLCFMNDEGLGSSSSSVSSMSPIGLLQMDSGGDAGVGERPSTSDSGCALDSFPTEPESDALQCVQCGTTCSSQWISLSSGYLCLDCIKSPAPETSSVAKRRKTSIASEQRECSNCHTRHTSLWRRNSDGNFNCNACGLYEKMNKMSRPLNMRRDVIKRRQRKTKQASKKQRTTYLNETPPHFVLSPMVDQRAYELMDPNTDVYSPPMLLPPMNRNMNLYSPVSSPVTPSATQTFSYDDTLTNVFPRSSYTLLNDLDLSSQTIEQPKTLHVFQKTNS